MNLLNIFGVATETFFLAALISIGIYLAILYYLLRFIFDVKRQLWNQKQQINILIKIATKLGVDENDDQLLDIKHKNNMKSNDNL